MAAADQNAHPLLQRAETLERDERAALMEAVLTLAPYCKDFNNQMSVLGFPVVPTPVLQAAKVTTAGAMLRILAEAVDPENGQPLPGRFDALCQGNDGRLFWLSAMANAGNPKAILNMDNLVENSERVRIRPYSQEVVQAVPGGDLERHLLLATDALVHFVHALETSLGMPLTSFD